MRVTPTFVPSGGYLWRFALVSVTALMATLPMDGVEAATGDARVTDAQFAVGNTTIFIHDASRGYDEAAGIESGIRTLITEIWYPVDPHALEPRTKGGGSGEPGPGHGSTATGARPPAAPFRRATYGDYVFGNRAVHRLMMTRTTFFHLTPDTVAPGVTGARIDAAIDELFTRERGSHVDAPVALSADPLPVIVMSHGDAGSRYNMQTVCEHLAAHGYVVIAPEHTGNSPFSMTGEDPALAANGGHPAMKARMREVLESFNEYGTYGPPDNYGQSYTPLAAGRSSAEALLAMDQALLQRIADLRTTLDELERLNRQGPFAGSLHLDRIGLMGRSFGASTVLSAMPLERRFLAGVAVAPPSMPDPPTRLAAGVAGSSGPGIGHSQRRRSLRARRDRQAHAVAYRRRGPIDHPPCRGQGRGCGRGDADGGESVSRTAGGFRKLGGAGCLGDVARCQSREFRRVGRLLVAGFEKQGVSPLLRTGRHLSAGRT